MEIDFTVKGHAAKRGRYVIAPGARIVIGDPDSPEIVGVGVVPGKTDAPALVHEHGPAQTGVPLYSVAQAVASTKVIPPAALVSAFVESGTLAKLKAAIDAYEKSAK